MPVASASRNKFHCVNQLNIRTVLFADGGPTSSNVASSCSVAVDRLAVAYDITFHLRFDETFTPAVISAINSLSVSSFQVNSNGDVIFAEATNRALSLGSNVTQGPFILNVLYDNLAQRANGIGYNFSVSIIIMLQILS